MIDGFPNLNELGRTALDSPGADRITFYDFSADVFTHLRANTGLAISGTDLNVTPLSFSLDDFSNTNLADPNADRITFWDDSAGQFAHLTTGTGLVISGTTMTVTLSPFSTTDLAEGGNLYYTQARFDTAFALKSFDDLTNTTLPAPGADRIVFWDQSAGVYTHLVPNTGIAISGTNLNVSLATFSLDDLNNTTLVDPNADRIVFWDDSAGVYTFLTPGTGLTITTTTMTVSLAPFSTTDLAEGTNLYHTSERVDDRVAALIQNGTGITWSYNDGSNTLTGNVSISGFGLDDLANTSLADPNADKLTFWDDSAGQFAHLEPNDGLAISGTDLNVTVTAPVILSAGNVTLDLTATYGWSGPHTFGAVTVFNEDVTFDGATASRDVVWDRSEDALRFADSATLKFGTGGLSGALGTDCQIYSDGTYGLIQIESIDAPFLGKNPLIRLRYGAPIFTVPIPALQFRDNGAGLANGIGILSHYLYVQDVDQASDGNIVVPAKTFPTVDNYLFITYDSAGTVAKIDVLGNAANRHLAIQSNSVNRFVGFHTSTPTWGVDFNADIRIRSNEFAYWGGTSTGDMRGSIVWGGTTFDVGMPRHPTANTAGSGMNVYAGGATSGATDKNGGTLTYKSGIATGNGGSEHIWQAVATGQGAGTTDRNPATVMRLSGTELELDVALNHDGTLFGIFGVTPAAQPTGYTTFTNLSTDRTCDADAVAVAELADIVGTLIQDLKTLGILAA